MTIWLPGILVGSTYQDLPDVLAYWGGKSYTDEEGLIQWRIHDWQRDKAEKLCAELNLPEGSGKSRDCCDRHSAIAKLGGWKRF